MEAQPFTIALPEPRRDDHHDWAFQLADVPALREHGKYGRGVTVAVVDGQGAHGYAIGLLIKTILPEATVQEYIATKASNIPYLVRQAAKQAHVVNLSLGTVKPPPKIDKDVITERIVDHVFHNDARGSLEELIRRREIHTEETSAALIAQRETPSALTFAHSKGVTIVAASGYQYHRTTETYAQFPQPIIVGAMPQSLRPIASPPDSRIDVYAPEHPMWIQQPAGAAFIDGHSIAASFVSAACGLVAARLVKDPERVKQTVLDGARQVNGYAVINFRKLLALLPNTH